MEVNDCAEWQSLWDEYRSHVSKIRELRYATELDLSNYQTKMLRDELRTLQQKLLSARERLTKHHRILDRQEK